MAQMNLFGEEKPAVLTVGELTTQIKDLLAAAPGLQDVWVQGEISNFSQPKSGHLYFTLKDASASLKCVMWRAQAARLTYLPRDGDQVEVHGGVGVYEPQGAYQLYADDLRPAGEGLLFQEFLRLKAQLEAEGLFALDHKRPLPYAPRVIGIVTSPTGAAVQDILNVLRRRFPLTQVVLYPAAVQGESAPREIVAGIQNLNQHVQPDVLIVGRGGGSIEDLWAFNDEDVARAIYNSAVPVISAVGHETDFTIADFVADLRAPTPTAAAELAVPDRTELRLALDERRAILGAWLMEAVNGCRWDLNRIQGRLERVSPQGQLRVDRQRLDEWSSRAERALTTHLRLQRARLDGRVQRLAALNPQAILERGFAVVSNAAGVVIKSTGQVKTGDGLTIRVADGSLSAEAKENLDG
jgi:exodeoxyribonuclease VII large subunit